MEAKSSGYFAFVSHPNFYFQILKELSLEIQGTSRSSTFRIYVIRRPQFTISTTSPSVMRRSYSHSFSLPGVTAVFTRPTSSLLDFLQSASRSRDLARPTKLSVYTKRCVLLVMKPRGRALQRKQRVEKSRSFLHSQPSGRVLQDQVSLSRPSYHSR
jgi:hypothetical protein